jgi:hypothetical protein
LNFTISSTACSSLEPDYLPADTTVFGHSTSQTFRPDFTTGARQFQLGTRLSF